MRHHLLSALCLALLSAACLANPPARSPANQSAGNEPAKLALPVREVTVFKDGHAYLLREGSIPADKAHELVLDELPVPVLGTFWPYATGGAKLVYAKAAREESETEVEAQNLRQLIEANPGKRATLKDSSNEMTTGVLLRIPKPEAGAPPSTLFLLECADGTRAMDLSQVRWLQIEGQPARTVKEKRSRERLTLRTEPNPNGSGGAGSARVGVTYVQNGLRWIPAYKFDIDGQGQAKVQLEASIVNDLIDLEQVTLHLVIGVPSFEFAGLVDAIALQREFAGVATQMPAQSAFYNAASNALRTQIAGFAADEGLPAPSPAVIGAEATEDLFVFSLANISLRKGERMTLPLREFTLSYRDIHTLDLPFGPPVEVRQQLPSERTLELARQLAHPQVIHVLRVRNTSDAPLTTAPALVTSKGRVLAQGKLFYTPVGSETDLKINPAIDIRVQSEERERGRVPNAVQWNNESYGRIDLEGEIQLKNLKTAPIEVEVRRRVLGLVDKAGQSGKAKQLEIGAIARELESVSWWGWWSWPYWWYRFNGFGEFRWVIQLQPGEEAKLESEWHYFWR